jgi:myxalamid-type nonribosomal peptide synthetase MxaA
LDLVPVDYVSQGIVRLALEPDNLGKNFNLSNPQPIPLAALTDSLQEQGHAVTSQLLDIWCQSTLRGCAPGHPLHPFVALFLEPTAAGRSVFAHYMPGDAIPQIDCRNALRALASSGISCPPADKKLMHRYIAFLVASGVIGPATQMGDADTVSRPREPALAT